MSRSVGRFKMAIVGSPNYFARAGIPLARSLVFGAALLPGRLWYSKERGRFARPSTITPPRAFVK
jgi:hypothetical protein